MATATKDVSLNKKVSQFFWRSWAIQASWNYERQMNMGFLYGMVPTLDRLYPDESDPSPSSLLKKEGLPKSHGVLQLPRRQALSSWASLPPWGGVRQGSRTSIPDSINAVKTSLMGPLSASVTPSSGTIRVIAFGLGVQLAQQEGSIMGPIWPANSSPIVPLC